MKNIILGLLLVILFGLSWYVINDFMEEKPLDKSNQEEPTPSLPAEPENPTEPEPTAPVASGECYVGGCSSQLCTDQPDAVSTCEYREEYACYQTAVCERQPSGQCGWTESPSLLACLNRANQSTEIQIR